MRAREKIHRSTLERVTTYSNLLMGAINIATTHWTAFLDGPISPRATLNSLQNVSVEFLSDQEKQALWLLSSVIEQAYPARPDDESETEQPAQEQKSLSQRDLYYTVFAQIVLCFAQDGRGVIRGLCISMPNTCGKDFIIAMTRSEPLALLILMY